MSMNLLSRILDPVSSGRRRAVWRVEPEGKSWLDRDMVLSFNVQTVNAVGQDSSYAKLPVNAGAWSFIKSIAVHGANGVELFRLDQVARYMSIVNLEYGEGLSYALSAMTTGTQLAPIIDEFHTIRKPLNPYVPPYSGDQDITRQFNLPMAKLLNVLPPVWPLWKSDHITITIDWYDNVSDVFVDATVASFTIDQPQLLYDLIQSDKLNKMIGNSMDQINYLEPRVSRQVIPATTNGTRQSVSLPMGYGRDTVTTLTLAIQSDVAPASGEINTNTITTAGTGMIAGSQGPLGNVTSTGKGATYRINTVDGAGGVTDFTLLARGFGYKVGDVLSMPSGNGDARITVDSVTALLDLNSTYRSDAQLELSINVKNNGKLVYPGRGLEKAGLLRGLNDVHGRMYLPPGCYGASGVSQQSCAMPNLDREADYVGCMLRDIQVGPDGMDIELARTGSTDPVQTGQATLWCFANRVRSVNLPMLAKAR